MQEEVVVALKRAQEKMKQQEDRGRKKIENWEVGDQIVLSIKNQRKTNKEISGSIC